MQMQTISGDVRVQFHYEVHFTTDLFAPAKTWYLPRGGPWPETRRMPAARCACFSSSISDVEKQPPGVRADRERIFKHPRLTCFGPRRRADFAAGGRTA